MVYETIKKAMVKMVNITPQFFEDQVKAQVSESGGLLTKEAAAYIVLDELGFRMDNHVMGNRDSAVFTYLVTRNYTGER